MNRLLGLVLCVAAAGYLGACALLFFKQRSLIYFPPRMAALRAPQVTTLAVPDALLVVSQRPRPGPKALIYLGGNAEDVSASLPQLAQAFPERSLFLLHYRGYAGSSGSPSEAALVADALALFDKVAADHEDVAIVGRSLGSGIAVQVAAARRVSKLVLVTPYDSLVDLAASHFPYFPVRWLLRDKYESWRHAPRVGAPVLVVAAGDDEIIPRRSTDLLASRFAPGRVSLRVIEGSGHNTLSDSAAYTAALQWAQ
ncbi:alpha/beta hydrolase [Massilia sp. DD77]|uniref:alpha/beta hydrolase n=1 Tax=Massilia sp. DD77 TaxID=3109349 RepID=UPI0030000DE5